MQDADALIANPWVRMGFVIVVSLVLYLLLTRIGTRFVRRLESRSPEAGPRAATLWLMLRRVIGLVLLVFALLMVFDTWGFSLTPFLAIGTVFGAAIGFGAQDLVKDVLAGFFILAEDQYRIGDTVTIADTSGTVEDIQFRITVLRDLEGNVHFVPNGQITVTSNFTNLFAQPVLDVGIAYGADVDHAMKVMLDELRALAADPDWKDLITDEPEMLGVQELAESSVIVRARMTTRADARWSARREALLRIKKRFDAEGIEIPFPRLTISQGDG